MVDTRPPLRILHVIDSLKVGGAEVVLIDMLRTHRRQGHQIDVAYFTPGPFHQELSELDIPTHRLSSVGIADPRAAIRLLGLIRRLRPHVVHTHLAKSDLVGQPVAALARVPLRITSTHNTDPWRRKSALARINRLAASRCRRVIAVSQEVHDYLVSTRSYPAEKIVTIEYGIDLERFDPQRQRPMDRLARWGIGPEHPTIGIVGRLEPQKAHEILLDAMARVTSEMPEVRLLVIGEGPLRPALEARRIRLGLDGRVIFAGLVRDIPAALAALDFVTFSSLWEGLPVALLEAMAMEKPVVATAVGGVPGVIHDGVSGVLVPSGDPDALARGLLRVLRNPTLARSMGKQARDIVRRDHSAERMHQRILALYRELLG